MGRQVSLHHGLNYHDEGFRGDWDSSWSKADKRRLADAAARLGLKNAAWCAALRTMYDSYNAAVHEANPASKVTCTPMWQGGLDAGTYAPQNFKKMSESFTHYLTEGVQQPWYVLHSLESFRRPGLPLMGVVDDAHNGAGEIVMNETLALSRGVQGVGISFTCAAGRPWLEQRRGGADVYRAINRLGKVVRADPRRDHAAERSRRALLDDPGRYREEPELGRPALGIGLRDAGRPDDGRRAGQHALRGGCQRRRAAGGRQACATRCFSSSVRRPLPATGQQAIAGFAAAGGKVFVDADSTDFPAATKLPFSAFIPAEEGFASDPCFITMPPKFEALAVKLKDAVAQYRRYPLDTDDAWISRGLFDGGAVRYVMLAAETRPFPWYGGLSYSFGLTYTRTVQPRTVASDLPGHARRGL